MPNTRARRCFAAGFLLLAACATTPARPVPAPPATPAPAQIANPKPAKVKLFCNEKALTAKFAALGIPSDESPHSISITDKYTWVLFTPARLVRLARQGDQVTAEMTIGHAGERWSSFDIDPLDGSAWVTSETQLTLLHFSPSGRETVKLKKVVGEGGFRQLLAAADGLYVVPTAADRSLWRLDRNGMVLDTHFPTKPAAAEEPQPEIRELRRTGVGLLRDAQGHICARSYDTGKTLQADGKGGWIERPDLQEVQRTGVLVPNAKGVNVGKAGERWSFSGGPGQHFLWKGRPAFTGSTSFLQSDGKSGFLQRLYVPDATDKSVIKEFEDGCPAFWQIATSATAYAAVDGKSVFFGDFADAPDLP